MSKRFAPVLYLLPFLAVVVSAYPLLALKFPKGHDWLYELVRVSEFRSALAGGQFPPYWANNLYGGYGSPIFLFYAPLYLSVSSLFSWLTSSIETGSVVAIITFSCVGALSISLLLREALGGKSFANRAASRVAASFFILNPYLLGDSLLRNANAEYAALCTAPLALYGLLIIGRRRLAGGLVLAAGLALTIMAHNLTALVTAAFICLAAAALYLPSKKSSLWIAAGGAGLGLGLSAFFWAPAVYYQSLVRIDKMTTGAFDFHNQFQSIVSSFGYRQFYSTGALTPLVILCAAGLLWGTRRQKDLPRIRLYLLAFCCSLLLLFLQTRASVYLWEHIPFMPLFQFPWRMMGPLAIVASLLAGLSFAYLCRDRSKRFVLLAEVMCLLVFVLNAVPDLKASGQLQGYVAARLSYFLEGESIKNLELPATASDEYLPRAAQPDIWRTERARQGPVVQSSAEIDVRVFRDAGNHIILETDSKTRATIRLGRWFFPGWECSVNGVLCDVRANKAGSLDIAVPEGYNRITLKLCPPYLRIAGLWVSLASAAVWCMTALGAIIGRSRRGGTGRTPTPLQPA